MQQQLQATYHPDGARTADGGVLVSASANVHFGDDNTLNWVTVSNSCASAISLVSYDVSVGTTSGIDANALITSANIGSGNQVADLLEAALSKPEHPVVAVVGGAKVSTKLDLLGNLIPKVDQIVIGGGMANTFLNAQGVNVGASLCEHDLKDTALEIMANAKRAHCEILLPVDVVAAKEFKAGAESRVCGLDEVADDEMILDAGPATVDRLADAIDAAKTLIWNGPLGAFELVPFDTATVEAAKYAAKRVKNNGLIAVAGGGDTVAALKHAGAADGFTFISTAGGAFLEWMEGKALPGVEILKK
ncbi:MAG: phosphoglycerate kinase [Robiginitomaculum sp.]|nr:MAG: phosphoglycerate kinase [Robiginitomaculum sp.]